MGMWKDGLYSGQGQILYNASDDDELSYLGSFDKGHRTKGLLVFANEDTYEGEFYHDKPHGQGIKVFKSDDITLTGTFIGPHGSGIGEATMNKTATYWS